MLFRNKSENNDIIVHELNGWPSVPLQQQHIYTLQKAKDIWKHYLSATQSEFTCSKLTIATLEQGVKYV